eukprot:gnl/MRDRNA2_/MRDRNA2_105993_c0_seq1.p1 gnl/MRDRNA2_/MRDRNA2_105993_c0~~gnl/MRDRNA2_/MRDRNA2_105993_c0_seq1.p1  ORF type:complete len:626 (+),score=136.55 gnl/MRDRNA2_/MRDRNA2_105993_c0_seq1:81-1958(+)
MVRKSKRVATSTALQGDLIVKARAVALHTPNHKKEAPNAACRIAVDCSPEECGKHACHFTTEPVQSFDPQWDEEFVFTLDWPEEPEEFIMKVSVFEELGEKGKISMGSCSLALPVPKAVWRGKFSRRLHTQEQRAHAGKGPPPGAVVLEVTFKPLNTVLLMGSAGRGSKEKVGGMEDTDDAAMDPDGAENVMSGDGDTSIGPGSSGRRRRGIDIAADIESMPFDFDPPEDTDLIGTLKLSIASAWGLRNADVGSKSDPYCKIRVPVSNDKKEPFITKVVDDSLEPDWDEEREFFINWHMPGPLELKFEIWDKDEGIGTDDLLGRCTVQMPTESCHIRYVCAVDDPKSSPKKRPKSKFPFAQQDTKPRKPGFQFDLHFWHLGQNRDEDFELEEVYAPDVIARVDPGRLEGYKQRIVGLQKRMPLLEKSLAMAQAERDAILAEFEETKGTSQELEDVVEETDEIKGLLQDLLMRSEDMEEMIETYNINDDTGARLIGIRPSRPPLLEEVLVMREAEVWLVFEQISEPPDHNLAQVSQLETLLEFARPSRKDGEKTPDSPKSPSSIILSPKQSRKQPPLPKIRDVLPPATKVGFNEVLDACRAMRFSPAEWKRLLTYGQQEDDDYFIG